MTVKLHEPSANTLVATWIFLYKANALLPLVNKQLRSTISNYRFSCIDITTVGKSLLSSDSK